MGEVPFGEDMEAGDGDRQAAESCTRRRKVDSRRRPRGGCGRGPRILRRRSQISGANAISLRDDGLVALVLDPSLLMGQRARVWLERAVRDGVLAELVVPAGILSPNPSDGWPLGAPRGLGRRYGIEPDVDLLAGARSVRHQVPGHPPLPRGDRHLPNETVALDVWAALVERHTLAARRTDVLDRLIQYGVVVEVRSLTADFGKENALWHEAWPTASTELLSALRRRTRLLARLDDRSLGCSAPRITVWDDGPYWSGSWR